MFQSAWNESVFFSVCWILCSTTIECGVDTLVWQIQSCVLIHSFLASVCNFFLPRLCRREEGRQHDYISIRERERSPARATCEKDSVTATFWLWFSLCCERSRQKWRSRAKNNVYEIGRRRKNIQLILQTIHEKNIRAKHTRQIIAHGAGRVLGVGGGQNWFKSRFKKHAELERWRPFFPISTTYYIVHFARHCFRAFTQFMTATVKYR